MSHAGCVPGHRRAMNGLAWLTIAILVLIGVVGVVAAFLDRRRGREIERDLGQRRGRR